MTDSAIIEAAARAEHDSAIVEMVFNALWSSTRLNDVVIAPHVLYAAAEAVLKFAGPRIEAAALEKAAKTAEETPFGINREEIAAAIRALKEQP